MSQRVAWNKGSGLGHNGNFSRHSFLIPCFLFSCLHFLYSRFTSFHWNKANVKAWREKEWNHAFFILALWVMAVCSLAVSLSSVSRSSLEGSLITIEEPPLTLVYPKRLMLHWHFSPLTLGFRWTVCVLRWREFLFNEWTDNRRTKWVIYFYLTAH